LFSATFKRHQEIGHGHFNRSCGSNSGKRPWMLLSKVYPVAKKKTELIIKLITEGNWKQILVSPIPNKA
jgi:hypothetical protein